MDIYEHYQGFRDEALELDQLARAFLLTGNEVVANTLFALAERLRVRAGHLLADVEAHEQKESRRARETAGGILKELLAPGAFQK